VVVCAAGFCSEHLELAYDLDIEAAALAADLGVAFARTRSLDDDPAFCALIAEIVQR
jgi:ferrochelatase